ncbi:MAG: hypothetical protein ACR2GR_11300 [Rhodothermales bacterium]
MQKSELSDYTYAVRLRPRKVLLVLLGVVGFLGFAHLAVYAIQILLQDRQHELGGFATFFRLSREANLPTFVSALNLLAASLLLSLIAYHKRRLGDAMRWHWAVLAGGMLLMSVDEAAQIHEGLVGRAVAHVTGPMEGIFNYVWYLAYLPLIALLAVMYIPFLRRLPTRYALGFMLAGLLFVGGAVGVEMIESLLNYRGTRHLFWTLSLFVEETCEMLGIVVFIYMLLCYIAEEGIAVRFSAATSEEPATASALTETEHDPVLEEVPSS